jgi:hypothetical protein
MRKGRAPVVLHLLKKFGPDRHLVVYDAFGSPFAAAPLPAATIPPAVPEVTDAITGSAVVEGFRSLGGRPGYVHTPLRSDDRTIGAPAVFLDASGLDTREAGLWQYNAARLFS